MANLRSHCQFLVFFYASFLILTCSSCHLCFPEKHSALFIFGDSLFDVGNNIFLKNTTCNAKFWPYGETFFKHPTGRASDGRLIPDFIAEYAKLPLIPPYLQPSYHLITDGVNFASGSAGALVETHQGKTIDLKTQVSYFKKVKKQLRQKLGDTETKALLCRAVYIFSIGVNDYGEPSLLQFYSREEYVGMVIGNLTSGLKEIYKKGGRKFGILSLGPMGCLPSMRARNSGDCMERVTVLVKLHNKALSIALKKLQSELQGFKYANFDFYNALSERINNPSNYGFKEVKAACCGSGPYRGLGNCGGKGDRKEFELCDNPSEYLFFDAHPTEKANNQLSKLMWSGSPDVISPYNLKQLFEE